MNTIPVYALFESPRLRYVLDWLLKEWLGLEYELINGQEGEENKGHGIAYGIRKEGSLFIPDEGLLRTGEQIYAGLNTGDWTETAFRSELPFDLFSAVFFLLARMEEWGSTALDKHFRYPHTQSLLHKKGWLQRPLVDEWCEGFRLLINAHFGWNLQPQAFEFEATYDIDIAWSYKHKGVIRALGGALRDLTKRRFDLVARRLRVVRGLEEDPFDAFNRMRELHRRSGLHPRYFVLAALQSSDFDKNISPQHPAMQALIQELVKEGSVGMHPSYRSQDVAGRFEREKEVLEAACGAPIAISRQHFIRYWPERTPRFLLDHGIREDYSMGYATAAGFRAGTSRSFLWYDRQLEAVTDLRIHPFCFMDSTAHYDMGLSAEAAFDLLKALREILAGCGGKLITVFHNFSLGTDPEWRGWWGAYEDFVSETVARYCGGTASVSQTPFSDL